jgi:hypothetical protein
MMMYMENFVCRMCCFKDFELLWDLKNATYGDLFKNNFEEALKVTFHPFALIRCNNCKLLQLRDLTDISGQYDEYLYSSKTTNALGDYYALTAARLITEYEISPDSLIIDIGSNDGTTLSAYPPYLKLVGVDPTGAKFKSFYQEHINLIPDFFSASLVCSDHRVGPWGVVCLVLEPNCPLGPGGSGPAVGGLGGLGPARYPGGACLAGVGWGGLALGDGSRPGL